MNIKSFRGTWEPLFFSLIVIMLLGTGCGLQAQSAIGQFRSAEQLVSLGDSKEKVLSIFEPSQKAFPSTYDGRSPDKYIKDEVKVEIYYFRSARILDGALTDDEFTPYIFNDGELVAIGWATLGGPKTRSRVVPRTNVKQEVNVK